MWRRQARTLAAAAVLLGLALALLAGPAAALPAPQGEQLRQQEPFQLYRDEPLELEEGPRQQGLGSPQYEDQQNHQSSPPFNSQSREMDMADIPSLKTSALREKDSRHADTLDSDTRWKEIDLTSLRGGRLDRLGGGHLVRSLDRLGGGHLVRSLDRLGGGHLVRSLDRLGGGHLLRSLDRLGEETQISNLGGGLRGLEVLGSRLLLRPVRGGPDALSGVAFGSSKRFDPLSGTVFGHQKRNFDEIDRHGFDSFAKRNFDEIDRHGFDSFAKRNFDEIDRVGFGSFVKRNVPNLFTDYYEKQNH